MRAFGEGLRVGRLLVAECKIGGASQLKHSVTRVVGSG